MAATLPAANPGTKRWLKCKIDKGMFSEERAVTYPREGEFQKSVFVSVNDVLGNPGEFGKVRVVVIERNGKLIAVLPSSRKDLVSVCAGDVLSE